MKFLAAIFFGNRRTGKNYHQSFAAFSPVFEIDTPKCSPEFRSGGLHVTTGDFGPSENSFMCFISWGKMQKEAHTIFFGGILGSKAGIIVRRVPRRVSLWEPLPSTTQACIDSYQRCIQTGFDTYQNELFLQDNIEKPALSTCPERTVAPDERPQTHFCRTPPPPKICGFLPFSASVHTNALISRKPKISENLQKNCEFGSVCPFQFVPCIIPSSDSHFRIAEAFSGSLAARELQNTTPE